MKVKFDSFQHTCLVNGCGTLNNKNTVHFCWWSRSLANPDGPCMDVTVYFTMYTRSKVSLRIINLYSVCELFILEGCFVTLRFIFGFYTTFNEFSQPKRVFHIIFLAFLSNPDFYRTCSSLVRRETSILQFLTFWVHSWLGKYFG